MTLVFSIAVVWWSVLIGLVITVGNPVTLNREQIFQSDYVVTADIFDKKRGQIVVEKEWKSDAELTNAFVDNLAETSVKPNQKWLLPLTRTPAGNLRVTSSQLPNQQPLVYPVNQQSLDQLSAILGPR